MQVTLPISGLTATLRDFVPHRVAVAFQEESGKALQGLPPELVQRHPTKDELLAEFGEDVLRALDESPEGEYEGRLRLIRQEYVGRKAATSGIDLGVIHAANLIKAEGMVLEVEGQNATRDLILDLPHEDVLFLLEEIEGVWEGQRKKNNDPPKG